eukprot:Opistho-1_new@95855
MIFSAHLCLGGIFLSNNDSFCFPYPIFSTTFISTKNGDMKTALRNFSLLLLCSLTVFFSQAQSTGKVYETKTVKSAIMGKDVHYTVYLPADYETSSRNYPVVYLLHGYTDDNTGWLQFGEINRYADKAIAEGVIPPMIIVMPDADSTWYINSYDGKEKYEDFFVKEFMPSIEKNLAHQS